MHSYQHGRLEDAVMQVLGAGNLIDLTRLDESAIRKLTKFFKGVCITEMKGNPPRKSGRRAIRGFDLDGAFFEFTNGDGHPTTIAVSTTPTFYDFRLNVFDSNTTYKHTISR